MTSKISLNKFHPARQLYRYSVKRTIGLTVLMAVFMLLMCPGYAMVKINSFLMIEPDRTYDLNWITPTVIMLTTVFTVAASLIYLFINFAFLYGRSSSDFFHSLPLGRNGLLASRFLASTVPVLLPTVLIYASMLLLPSLDRVTGSAKTVLVGFAFNVLLIFMSAAFTMIFIVSSGSVFDLIISFFSFNVGVILVQVINHSFCEEFLWGFNDSARDLLEFSTPFYYGFKKLYSFLYGEGAKTAELMTAIVNILLITAVSLITVFLLYRRRKSEKSGVGYAYKFIYFVCALIVGYLGAYFLGQIFADSISDTGILQWAVFCLFAVCGAMLAAVTFGAINDRGFKTVKKSFVIGGCSVVSMALVIIILYTGCFGYSAYVPKSDKVKSVSIVWSSGRAELKNAETVTALHEKIINANDRSRKYNNLYFEYNMKNGKTVHRRFNVDYAKYKDVLLGIFKSEENIKGIRENFAAYKTNLSIAVRLFNVEKYKDDSSLPKNESDIEDTEALEDQIYYGVYITPAELNGLAEAYISDIPKATEKSLYENEYSYGWIDISGHKINGEYKYTNIQIEESFINTINYLKSLDLPARADQEVK